MECLWSPSRAAHRSSPFHGIFSPPRPVCLFSSFSYRIVDLTISPPSRSLLSDPPEVVCACAIADRAKPSQAQFSSRGKRLFDTPDQTDPSRLSPPTFGPRDPVALHCLQALPAASIHLSVACSAVQCVALPPSSRSTQRKRARSGASCFKVSPALLFRVF